MSETIDSADGAEIVGNALTKEEIARRTANKGLGGSDMAKLLGASRWGSPLDVWAQKLGLVPKEPERPEQEFGKLMEPKLAQWYADSRGVILTRPGFMRHPIETWAIGFIDRRWHRTNKQPESRIVEIKTSRVREGWGDRKGPGIPLDAYVQVQHYLFLAAEQVADVVALVAGAWPPAVYTVALDDDMVGLIVEKGREFWQRYVLTGDPPPVDGSKACAEYLAKRWPREQGEVLTATLDDYAAAEELKYAREALKAAEERVLLASNRLKARMGEATVLEGEGFYVTWKNAAQFDRIEYKDLIAELAEEFGWQPDDLAPRLAKHTRKAGGGRRFMVHYDEEGA